MSIATQLRIRRNSGLLLTLALLSILFFFYGPRWPESEDLVKLKHLNGNPNNTSVHKGIVMAKTAKEDIRWLAEFTPDWTPYIYTTSKRPEPGFLLPPSTRGHESITYLTYIISHYANLPAYSLFLHASHDQWHNDILGPETSAIIKHLRLSAVDTAGYLNLRCAHDPGCPIGVNPLNPTPIDIKGHDKRAYFAQFYTEILGPDVEVPEHIGNVCCGQFVVSRARILERPREAYERMRSWAMETQLTDDFGVGWVFEKLWHIIFGMEPVHCPPVEQCRCDLFGWCGPLPQNCSAADGK